MKRLATVPAIALAATLVATACHKDAAVAPTATATVPADAISKITENGPVKATVRVWPAKPTLDGEVMVQLTISVTGKSHLDSVCMRLRKISGIHSIERAGTSSLPRSLATATSPLTTPKGPSSAPPPGTESR